jgi:hypothetical protein
VMPLVMMSAFFVPSGSVLEAFTAKSGRL